MSAEGNFREFCILRCLSLGHSCSLILGLLHCLQFCLKESHPFVCLIDIHLLLNQLPTEHFDFFFSKVESLNYIRVCLCFHGFLLDGLDSSTRVLSAFLCVDARITLALLFQLRNFGLVLRFSLLKLGLQFLEK